MPNVKVCAPPRKLRRITADQLGPKLAATTSSMPWARAIASATTVPATPSTQNATGAISASAIGDVPRRRRTANRPQPTSGRLR